MHKFKIGDTVRITPPPGAPSDWHPRHGSPPHGEWFGKILTFDETNNGSRYAIIDLVEYGIWTVDQKKLVLMEPQNVSAPTRRGEW